MWSFILDSIDTFQHADLWQYLHVPTGVSVLGALVMTIALNCGARRSMSALCVEFLVVDVVKRCRL